MHISGFFIQFSLTPFPPPPAQSSPLLPGLTKANCHRTIWAIQRLRFGQRVGAKVEEHPTRGLFLKSNSLRRKWALRLQGQKSLPTSPLSFFPNLSSTF